MRNDARPIGEDSPASPIGGREEPMVERRSWNGRTPDREAHSVNRGAQDDEDATVRWQPRRSIRRSADR